MALPCSGIALHRQRGARLQLAAGQRQPPTIALCCVPLCSFAAAQPSRTHLLSCSSHAADPRSSWKALTPSAPRLLGAPSSATMQVEFFIQAVPSPSDAEIDLGEAARLGDAEAVAAALAAPLPDGTRLNVDATCDINGATALIIAAQQGHEDVVEVLLRAGANPNERSLHNPLLFNDGGGTPLTAAAFSGHTAVVQRLIEAGADVNARRVGDSVTPMCAVPAPHMRMSQQPSAFLCRCSPGIPAQR